MLQNVLLDKPPEEVELAYRRDKRLHAAYLETNALTAAERVKQPLAISIQLAFVIEIHKEMLASQRKTGIHLFRIVGDKIIDQT